MSDEIIEGRDIRNKPPETPPVQEAPPPAQEGRRSRLKGKSQPKAEDEKSGPYVTLAPPDEAGDPIRAQADEPTFHKGMKPVISEPAAADEIDPSAPAPDLPWDVIETPGEAAAPARLSGIDSLMKLPRVEDEPPAAPPQDDSPPHVHTPTGPPPPVPDEPKKRRVEPPRIGGEFIPHLHTPTEELPPVPDDVEPEADVRAIHVEPIPDDDLPPIRRAEDALTPGILPRIHDDDEADREIPPIRRGSRRRADDEDEEDDDRRGHSVALEEDTQGGLPRLRRMVDPVTGEVVDADWVREIGDGEPPRREPKRQRGRGVEEAIAQRLEARRAEAQRKPAFRLDLRTILTIISILALIALAIYIPLRLGLFGGAGGPGGKPTAVPSPTIPSAGGPTAAPSGAAPGGGGLAYQQGRLAFASNREGNYEIYTLDMATGALTRLTNNKAADRFPAWSPDGKQIAYVSNSSGNDDLYVIPAGGGTAVQLTTDPGSDRNPSWSPDGKQLVSTRENVDGSRLVSFPTGCIAQPTTCESQIKMLTPGGYDRFPSWAPNGARLAFTASDLPGSASVIALLNPDGSGYQSFPGTKTSDLNPAWSPDGSKIAFLSYAEGDYDLWVMYSDGTGVTQITKSQATDGAPAWSPDGKYIAFASDRDDKQHFNLYLLQTDCLTTGVSCEDSLIQVTNGAADDLDPAWIR